MSTYCCNSYFRKLLSFFSVSVFCAAWVAGWVESHKQEGLPMYGSVGKLLARVWGEDDGNLTIPCWYLVWTRVH